MNIFYFRNWGLGIGDWARRCGTPGDGHHAGGLPIL